MEGNQHGGAASRYLMCVSDGSEASQEVGCLHVQVAVDREEPVTCQRGKQLADCRLSTAAAETGGSRRSVSVISPSWRSNPSRARVSELTRCLRPAAPTRRIEAPVPPAPPAASWPESTPRGGTPPGHRRCCRSGDLASRGMGGIKNSNCKKKAFILKGDPWLFQGGAFWVGNKLRDV